MKSITTQILSFLPVALFIFMSISVSAQIIEKRGGIFYQDDHPISKEKMGDLMLTNTSSDLQYYQHLELKSRAKKYGVTSLVLVAGGGLLIMKGRSTLSGSNDNLGEALGAGIAGTFSLTGGVIFLVGGAITGLVSLSTWSKSKSHLKSAINMYNDSQLKSDHGSQEIILNINLKSNGIGLSYTF